MILVGRGDTQQGQILGCRGKLDGCSDSPAPRILMIPPASVRITRLAGFPDELASLDADLAVGECFLERKEPTGRLGNSAEQRPGVWRHRRRLEIYKDLLIV